MKVTNEVNFLVTFDAMVFENSGKVDVKKSGTL